MPNVTPIYDRCLELHIIHSYNVGTEIHKCLMATLYILHAQNEIQTWNNNQVRKRTKTK